MIQSSQPRLNFQQNHANIHQNVTNTSLITSIWTKRAENLVPQQLNKLNSNMEAEAPIQPNNIEQQPDKVIISKKQLQQFTKKFAINQIDYQEKIQSFKSELDDKNNRIKGLSQQVEDLRVQQNYLMKVMEQLRDRHVNQLLALNIKNQTNIKLKQSEIDYLKEQIIKIRSWLQEEKQEAKRCMQFLKIKDEIIQNLEWEIVKVRNQCKNIKEKDKFKENKSRIDEDGISSYLSHTLRIVQNGKFQQPKKQRTSSTKKIIIRKQNKQNKESKLHKQGSSTQKKQKSSLAQTSAMHTLQLEKLQLQNQKFEIFSKYREVSLQNQCLKKSIQNLQKQRDHFKHLYQNNKIARSINQLDQISRRIKQSQIDKENLLFTKCMHLEKHVQKLTKQLNRNKNSQVILQFSNTQLIQELYQQQTFPQL